MPDVDPELIGPPLPGVTEVELDGRICVYAPEHEHVLFLNHTASDVWRLADGELTAGEIVSLLAASYGLEAGAIADDVRAAIARFRQAGALPGGAAASAEPAG